MGPLRLLDLDHAGEVLQLQRTAEIVQVVHIEWRVFRGEFDIVVVAGLTDQLHERRPGRKQMRAEGRLSGRQQRAQAIRAHDRGCSVGSVNEDMSPRVVDYRIRVEVGRRSGR
jgi:hypothetical protein